MSKSQLDLFADQLVEEINRIIGQRAEITVNEEQQHSDEMYGLHFRLNDANVGVSSGTPIDLAYSYYVVCCDLLRHKCTTLDQPIIRWLKAADIIRIRLQLHRLHRAYGILMLEQVKYMAAPARQTN